LSYLVTLDPRRINDDREAERCVVLYFGSPEEVFFHIIRVSEKNVSSRFHNRRSGVGASGRALEDQGIVSAMPGKVYFAFRLTSMAINNRLPPTWGDRHSPRVEGCQIFLGPNITNWEICNKWPQSIPNGHELYQMAIKCSKWP
jgi:hypothetical protein